MSSAKNQDTIHVTMVIMADTAMDTADMVDMVDMADNLKKTLLCCPYILFKKTLYIAFY